MLHKIKHVVESIAFLWASRESYEAARYTVGLIWHVLRSF
jgi:hypothetical protein